MQAEINVPRATRKSTPVERMLDPRESASSTKQEDEPTGFPASSEWQDIYYDEQPTVEPVMTDTKASFMRRIITVQRKLKAPKNQFNSFGGYKFRSCEDILEGLKPLLEEYDLLLSISDDIVFIEGRFYVKATAIVMDPETGESVYTTAFAREPDERKKSDVAQVTGSCSSYARKYALNAMWLIDDTKDVDEPQRPKEPPAQGPFVARCESCGTQYQFQGVEQYKQFLNNPQCCATPRWLVV